MTPSSRSAQFTHLHKMLKGFYKPVGADAQRPVLEHLLFASVLENAHYPAAEEAFAALTATFFDWNEIRVSSVRELAEAMPRLPDPPAAAARVKGALQHVFEATYSFDMESLRKQNLGPATQALAKTRGVTPFGVAYVVQSALGGHAIPLDAGTLEVMRLLEMATDEEVASSTISGLERAIPKNKGVEFGSLLHQIGADFTENPFAADLREKLLAIDPKVKPRLPKRTTRKEAEAAKAAEAEKLAAEKSAAEKRAAEKLAAGLEAKSSKKKTSKPEPKADAKPEPKAHAESKPESKKPAKKSAASEKPAAEKASPEKQPSPKVTGKKRIIPTKKPMKGTKKKPQPAGRKGSASAITKKKPR